jgi:hypothetical protein
MDKRHSADSDAPTWNESWYFNFVDPEQRIGGYARIGLLPNTRCANMWFALFKDGEQVYDRIRFARPLPTGDIDDANGLELDGLRLRAIRLLEQYRVQYEDPYTGLSLDLTWDAVHPSYNNSLRHLHLEQAATVVGQLNWRGQTYTLKGPGFRDHATGKRDWEAMGSHELVWPAFEDGTALGIVSVHHRRGTVDGLWSWDGSAFSKPGLRDLKLQTDARGIPTGIHATLSEPGKPDLQVEGSVLSVCQAFFDGYRLHECMARYVASDGRVGHGLLEIGRRPGS